MSEKAHAAVGDMLALVVRKEVCEVQRRQALNIPVLTKNGPWPTGEDLGKILPMALWSSWRTAKNLGPIQPLCQTAVSPLSPLKPLSHSSTFKLHEWNGKAAWGSSQPGSQIRLRFAGTKVGLFVWCTNGQSAEESTQNKRLRRETAPVHAMCWVDDGDMTGSSDDEFEKEFAQGNLPESQRWFVIGQKKRRQDPSEFIELAEGLTLACEVSSEFTSGGFNWRVQGTASQ
ncbi:hypothetical protein JCM11641_006390 [Rhodosporidiobolus odoratus]